MSTRANTNQDYVLSVIFIYCTGYSIDLISIASTSALSVN